MTAPKKKNLPWWGVVLLSPVIVAVVPLAIFALVLYVVVSAFLYVAIWLLWCSRGKDVLFVYSDSPVWHAYLEAQVLPKIADRAIILNWSERKKWSKMSLAYSVFTHFGGYQQFNPLGIVFSPWRRAQVFRFWQAFRDFKHGHDEALKKMQSDFLHALAEKA